MELMGTGSKVVLSRSDPSPADVASGTTAGLGGFLEHDSCGFHWFALTINANCLRQIGLHLEENLQKHIAFLELLAQFAVLRMFVQANAHMRLHMQFATQSDNTAAEATANAMFTTHGMMAMVVHRILQQTRHFS